MTKQAKQTSAMQAKFDFQKVVPVNLDHNEVMAITLTGLQYLMGGETIYDGFVCTDCLRGLYSPTLMPVREATDLDRTIFTVIEHIMRQAKEQEQRKTA